MHNTFKVHMRGSHELYFDNELQISCKSLHTEANSGYFGYGVGAVASQDIRSYIL